MYVNPHEKMMQRALIQYRDPKNYELVKEALIKTGREDLIGFDRKCLIRPRGSDGAKLRNKDGSIQQKKNTKKKKTIRNRHPKKDLRRQ